MGRARKFPPQLTPTPAKRRRLIVNADDFGRSSSINDAVMGAHLKGILTSASLMVSADATEEAVCLARQQPNLAVGLHLTLACGRCAAEPRDIPQLVDRDGNFTNDPVRAGLVYFFDRNLRAQLEREIEAQFARFRSFGLPLDHVNGHLNLHLHPVIFGILMRHAARWNITALRLTRDPLRLNLSISSGRWLYRLSHGAIFGLLSARARPLLKRRHIHHTQRVFGLLQYPRVDTAYLQRLLARLPEGDSELYSHPSLAEFKHEFAALTDPAIRALVEEQGIELIRYRDL